jgi:predicted dehydrogenase
MNLGIIGYGYTGQQHARAAAAVPGIHLVAIAESDPSQSARADIKVYRYYQNLLQDASIDAVSVCLPHFLHEQVTHDVLNAGKHALVEKPLAITAAAGERLCQQANKVSRVLMVEMTHRFMLPIIEARQLIQGGEVGELLAVTDTVVESIGLLGSFPSWMLSKKLAGGGVGLTSGIHLIDHLSWIMGKPLALNAACFGHSQGFGDVEDTAALFLTAKPAVPVEILLSWRREGKGLEAAICFYGSKGTLQVDCWRGWKLENGRECREKNHFVEETPIAGRSLIGMTSALAEFAASIHQNRCPTPTADETLVSQRLIEQAYKFALDSPNKTTSV